MYTGKGAYARYAVSEDGGATWSKMLPLLFDGERLKETIVLFSDMIRLKNGTYMATFHFPGQVCKAITKDGLSFGKPEVIVQHPKAFLCEACFIRSPDGNKIALLMRENNRSFLSMISFSGDEGKTWTTPREMPASLCGDRHQHVYTPDGRIFVSFRDKGLDSPTWGDWVAWVGTFEDLEEGNEGQYRIRLKDKLGKF
jgi:hypothetical protein